MTTEAEVSGREINRKRYDDIIRKHKFNIVTDELVQCERCKMWDRLYEKDEDGMRTIPLFIGCPYKPDGWLCDKCWGKQDEKCLDNHDHAGDTYEVVPKMTNKTV